MDRKTVYPGEQPNEADLLYGQRLLYEGVGLLIRDLIGTGTAIAGLACNPTGTPSMMVTVAPGRIYTLANLEPTGWGQIAGLGGLASDTNADHQIIKQGLLRDTTTVGGGGSPFTAPVTGGQSINYLIQAQFVEADSTPTQRVYYNSQNPSVPVPSDVSDFRLDQLVLSVKAGTAATTGSQVTPSADAGCVPVWIVTVAHGQTTITSGNITQHPSAPYFSLWSVSTLLNVQQQLLLSGIAAATGVSGTLNDYNPTGWSAAATLRITTSGAVTLNGLAGGAGGRVAVIENHSASTNDIAVVAGAGGSSAANRFAALPSGQSQINIRPGHSALFLYDATASLWRYISGANTTTAADIWKATNFGAFVTAGDLAASAAFGTLTDAATIAWEIATSGYDATVTLTASGHQIGAPTLNGGALYDGCSVLLEIVEDGTGGWTCTWNTVWDFGASGTPSLNTGANKRTWVSGVYRSATSKIHANAVWRSA